MPCERRHHTFRCRPCESRDPYAAASRFSAVGGRLSNNKALWLWSLLSQGRQAGLPPSRSNSLSCCPCCRHGFAISPHVLREVCKNIPPSEIRGRRECRALDAPAASRVERNTRVSHHGHTGTTRHSPRSGFTVSFVLPGDRAFLPPSSAEDSSANLTPASGCQDHTTSPSAGSALVFSTACVHRIPPPTSVTIAKRPSRGSGTAAIYN
jgi:hypothetical protein